jgi:pimeloyl-ACP methyl ester carboxylesterase
MAGDVLEMSDGRRIAYHRTAGAAPAVVFLGGLRSDMTGTKATWLEDWAKAAGRAFLRFDYTGHGASSGRFEDGGIGDWAADAEAAVARLTERPVVLVGSSMGGWIALLLAKRMPERIAGLVGIAAAPDFTEDSMWAGFDADQRRALRDRGAVVVASEYDPAGYPITRRLIEDGREQLVLRQPLALPFPVRLLHGTADADVAVGVALRLIEHADCPDMRLTLVKGADHRFSTPECLALIGRAVDEVSRG